MKKILFAALTCLFLISNALCDDSLKGKIDTIDLERVRIDISGVTIDAKTAQIQDTLGRQLQFGDLESGDCLIIDGSIYAPANMTALKITKLDMDYDMIKGKIEGTDYGRGVLVIGGIQILVDNGANLTDSRGKEVPLESFQFNYYVRCIGHWDGPKRFLAERVQMD